MPQNHTFEIDEISSTSGCAARIGNSRCGYPAESHTPAAAAKPAEPPSSDKCKCGHIRGHHFEKKHGGCQYEINEETYCSCREFKPAEPPARPFKEQAITKIRAGLANGLAMDEIAESQTERVLELEAGIKEALDRYWAEKSPPYIMSKLAAFLKEKP